MTAYSDTAYVGLGPAVRAPFRRSRRDRATRRFAWRSLSAGQKAVNRSHSALRASGERASAEIKNWRILRKIRFSPAHTSLLIGAIQAVIINAAAV